MTLICNKDHEEGIRIFDDFKKIKGATYNNIWRIMKYKNKYDWVIAIEEACSYPALVLAKLSGAKLAVLSHGTSLMKKKKQLIKRFLFNQVLKRTDLFIANSYSTLKLSQDKIFARPKSRCVITPGVDYKKFNQKEKVDFGNKTIIFSAGGLIPARRQEDLFQIMPQLIKKFPYLLYVIAGDGPKRQMIEKMVKDMNLQDHVLFLGNISKDIEKYYQACDLYVMLGQDTFGISFLEASASGKPVLTIGDKETVVDSCTGYVCKDIDDLYRKIVFLLRSPKIVAEMGRNGKIFAKGFSWENIAKTYEAKL